MRHVDASYRWFELDAASLPSQDRRNLRCVGLVRDATDTKRAQERLLHNAVYDSLSGLPNRQLFLDRLAAAAKRATLEPLIRPSLLFIDIDRFRAASASVDLPAADSLLLTLARRLGQTFRIRRGAEICEILTPMLRDGRRIPRDRAAWLDALSRSHQVIAAKPVLASVGPPRSAGP